MKQTETQPPAVPPVLDAETMASLHAIIAARVGPSWMEWFCMSPAERARATAATPPLASEWATDATGA